MSGINKLFVGIAAALGLQTAVQASTQEGWQFELTPYIWAAGLDTDVAVRSQKASIDQSFNDIIKHADAAFMGMGVISYDRFVMYLDVDYVSLSADGTTKNGIVFPADRDIKADFDQKFVTGGIGYRFDTFGENSTIDVMIGVRNTRIETALKLGSRKISSEEDVTDPLLILRPSFQLSENWRFNPTLSYGVGGDSDKQYELMPQFQYSFSDSFAFRFGYKKLYYKIEDGSKNSPGYRQFDGSFDGPFIGVGWVFPSREKPVAHAPTPAPVPAPAPVAAVEKCVDSDGDGVCDAVDQCPNTPRGKRVGPAGCDCDYTLTTHFAFDSAALASEDRSELDKLANVLANPKLSFVVGNISGFTDSVGKPEYNQKLSERRAQAVADYLKEKGVVLGSRMQVSGFGEDNPLADNRTEEGRAQNRRVTISRTDCGSSR